MMRRARVPLAVALCASILACRGKPSDTGLGPQPLATGSVPLPAKSVGAGQRMVRLHVVDVGTGLAVALEGPSSPQGPEFVLIYDGGSNDDLRDATHNRFVSYLRHALPSVSRIDHLIVSHAHRDHVEYLPDVLDHFDVREVWEPGVLYKPCAYLRFLDAVSRKRPTYHTASRGSGVVDVALPEATCAVQGSRRIAYGEQLVRGRRIALAEGVFLTFLHVDGARRDDINENSLVVRVDIWDRSVLLVGDAGGGKRKDPSAAPQKGSVEATLLSCCRASLDVDVLVVGHHGSKTSSRRSFLSAVTPELSVISSGPHRYDTIQLPDREVVAALESFGAVMRTDRDDVACAANPAKIGRDGDGKPGGCDNVVVSFEANKRPVGQYVSPAD